jgi:hypothetical protein
MLTQRDESLKITFKINQSTYNEDEPDALKTIAEWNAAWGGYTEE